MTTKTLLQACASKKRHRSAFLVRCTGIERRAPRNRCRSSRSAGKRRTRAAQRQGHPPTSTALRSARAAPLGAASLAAAKTDQSDWPRIDGVLLMNTRDQSPPLDARPGQDIFARTDPSYTCDGLHRNRSVDCGRGRDRLYVSRRAKPHYAIRNCERVSHRTLGR